MILNCPFCDSPIKEFHKSCKAFYTCGTEKILGGWKQSPLCKTKASNKSPEKKK